MEYRQLGASGFKVPVLTLGTGTFGGGNEFFKAWGGSDVAALIIGARNEEQLRQNIGATGWKLSPAQMAKLDAASAVPLTYPYWHQRSTFLDRNPPAV